MGTQSIVYGRILLDKNFEKSRDYIKALPIDEHYPFIRTEMFSLGADKKPFFYNEPVISFGATYKAVEYDWKDFILKFEHILRNIDFDTARIKLETEFLGTYDFFWKKKSEKKEFEADEKLIETNEWHFGYGDRCRWGLLNTENDEPIFDFENFVYPVKISEQEINAFKTLMKNIDKSKVGLKQYPYRLGLKVLKLYHLSRVVFMLKSFKNELDFGFDYYEDKDGNSIFNAKKMYIVIK